MSDDARLRLVRWINAAAVIAVVGMIWGAFGFQWIGREVPCPLCLLQRLGLLAIAAGGILNLRFGVRPAHYGVTLLGALVVGTISLRQIALHICSGATEGICTGYGAAPLGWHLYTWAFIAAAVTIAAVAILLMIPTPYIRPPRADKLAIAIIAFVGLTVAINVAGVTVQCGVGICEDPPYSASMDDPANVALGLTPGFMIPTWQRDGMTLRFAKGGAMTLTTTAGTTEDETSFPDPTVERMVVTSATGACAGQKGEYDVSIVDGALVLGLVQDACAERATALAGTWTRG